MITASSREEGRSKVKSQESKGSNWSLQWMDVTPGCQASNATGVPSLLTGLEAVVGHWAQDIVWKASSSHLKSCSQQSYAECPAGSYWVPRNSTCHCISEVHVRTFLDVRSPKLFSVSPRAVQGLSPGSLPKWQLKMTPDKTFCHFWANPILKTPRHWAKPLKSSSNKFPKM